MLVDFGFHYTPDTQVGEQFSNEAWNAAVDELYRDFPGGGSEGILPPHFVRATFPKIGGRIISASDRELKYWGLLLPGHKQIGRSWTLRSHWVGERGDLRENRKRRLEGFVANNVPGDVGVFDVETKRHEEFYSGALLSNQDSIAIHSPSRPQAIAAQELHHHIWHLDDRAYLYPYDLYYPDAGTATRLVAVHDEHVVGFLFGFYGQGKQWFGPTASYQSGSWVESQLLGVDRDFRRAGIAKRLKLAQRAQATEAGIDLIHWTVDPLQPDNAWLNFNHLGAVSAQFYKNYYEFKNDLNRVPASRIGISWILNTPRVSKCAQGASLSYDFDRLVRESPTEIVTPVTATDNGIEEFESSNWIPSGDTVLVELPEQWNNMQRDHVDVALRWRLSSDRIFDTLLNKTFRYVIIGITTQKDTGRVFLIARQTQLIVREFASNA